MFKPRRTRISSRREGCFTTEHTQNTEVEVISYYDLCRGFSKPIFSVISVPSVVKSEISKSVDERKIMKPFVVSETQ